MGLGIDGPTQPHATPMSSQVQSRDAGTHLVLEGVDGLTQPLHDGLALARDALAREELGLGVSLGLDLGARGLRLRLRIKGRATDRVVRREGRTTDGRERGEARRRHDGRAREGGGTTEARRTVAG
jgi:hypothetical protein